MTRKEFETIEEEQGFNEAVSVLAEEHDTLQDEETLKSMILEKVQNDDFGFALHLLKAIYNSDAGSSIWYYYDYSDGTTKEPVYLQSIKDITKFNLLS